MSTSVSVVERVAEAVEAFEAVQQQYDDYGAWDTEPDGVFQVLLKRAFVRGSCKVPRTGSAWQLYTASMNCTEAGMALGRAAQVVVDLIVQAPLRERRELGSYLKGYCWRCS